MKTVVACAVVGIAPWLTGCVSTTRYVKVTQAPSITRSAGVDELVKQIDRQFDAIKTLNASVMIAVSTGGTRTGGEVKDYTSLRGYILVRKPEDLRVILLAPVIGTRVIDMVSDGKKFMLLLPTRSRALMGTDVVEKPSKNPLENLRPGIFFDALLVRSIGQDEFVTVTESSRVVAPELKHHEAVTASDYDLTVMKKKSGHTLERVRVVHVNRDVNLDPYQQDIYDEAGRLVTTVQYSNYQSFGDLRFPTEIVINRPYDEYTLKVTVQKLTPNQAMDDDQFQLQVPAGITPEMLK